jgi:REP element-mobilizing transposase RayT
MAAGSCEAHPLPVYEPLSPLGGSPQYRRDVVPGEGPRRVQARFPAIAEHSESTMEAREVRPEPVPLLCACPPRSAIAPVVTRGKRGSARASCRAGPPVKRRLWGGACGEEGSLARPVGDTGTAAVIRRSLQPHRLDKTGDAQWRVQVPLPT